MASKQKLKAEKRKEIRKNSNPVSCFRNVRISARKTRIVANMIRGMGVSEADALLAFQRKSSTLPLRKVLASAVANAENKNFDLDKLFITRIEINKGPIMRRFMPRAQGRATRIRKQTAHITIELGIN